MAAQDFSTYDILPFPGLIKLSLLENKRLLTESGMRAPSPSENLGRSGGWLSVGREKAKSVSLDTFVTLCCL